MHEEFSAVDLNVVSGESAISIQQTLSVTSLFNHHRISIHCHQNTNTGIFQTVCGKI